MIYYLQGGKSVLIKFSWPAPGSSLAVMSSLPNRRSMVSKIATITGHALRDVETILAAHDLRGNGGLAGSAISQSAGHETGIEIPKQTSS